MTASAKDTETYRVSSVILIVRALHFAASTDQQHNPRDNDEFCPLATVRETADRVLAGLQAKDGQRIASLVHQEKGVRFYPNAYVNLNEDVVFRSAKVAAFWTDNETILWGYAEGRGDPFESTPADYAERYIQRTIPTLQYFS